MAERRRIRILVPPGPPPYGPKQKHIGIGKLSLKAKNGPVLTSERGDPATLSLPTNARLKQAGGPERLLSDIIRNLAKARMGYRKVLDSEVARSVVLARFLLSNLRRAGKFFNGTFLEHHREHTEDPSQALRWVLKRVFRDEKKASKIYNATKVMFSEGVAAADFPACVRKAGGYSKLAAANAKKRTPTQADLHDLSEPIDEVGSERPMTRLPAAKAVDLPDRAGADEGGGEHDRGRARESSVALIGTFEDDGQELLELPFPCTALICAHMHRKLNGRFAMRIFFAQKVD